MKTLDGQLSVIAGSSRCGKTAWTRDQVATAPRAFAWDPEDQWSKLAGWQRIDSAAALAMAACRPGPGRYAFVAGGNLAQYFDIWAACVFRAADKHGPLVAVAEELSDVTTPAKAPGAWGILIRRGLKRGVILYAISQRWAEADKTALGNASEIIVFRQSSADDVRYMSRKTRIPAAEIDGLIPLERNGRLVMAPYVRYNCRSQTYSREELRFSR